MKAKLRFDFSHDKPLTQNEISTIEKIVNKEALNNLEVKTELMKLDDAIKSGAMALFGEKYDDDVRVLTMGENSYSVELCGGTHVARTGDIGFFAITTQSSVASGIRRVEAVAGMQALNYIKKLKEVNSSIQNLLNVSTDDIHDKIKSLIDENKDLKSKGNKNSKREIVFSESIEINDWNLVIQQVQLDDTKDLRLLADEQKNTNEKVCVVIFSEQNNKIALFVELLKILQISYLQKR